MPLHPQVDQEIVTIEIPESVSKQWEGKAEWKTFHEEFLGRNPLIKTFKGAKKAGNSGVGGPKGSKTTVSAKRKQPPPDFSTSFTGIGDLPADDEKIAEVPVINARAASKLATLPMLVVTKKVGIMIKNETGAEVLWLVIIDIYNVEVVSLRLLP